MSEPTSCQGRLIDLYEQTSKHSSYQMLATPLRKLIPAGELKINSRYEEARLRFIREHVDLREKSVVDVGGNTGFFSFEAIEAGAASVALIEGNAAHCRFVSQASSLLKLERTLAVFNEYVDFKTAPALPCFPTDVLFLLNVLHHVGDDFGCQAFCKTEALGFIAKSLQTLSSSASTMIFQLGFNWKGDRQQCLFRDGTKKELIQFVRDATRDHWHVTAIGIAERTKQQVRYALMDADNIHRDDTLGEFLNRPLFVLSRKGN